MLPQLHLCSWAKKQPNKDGEIPSAEVVEERQLTKGNALGLAAVWTQGRIAVSIELQRVRKVWNLDGRFYANTRGRSRMR